MRALCTPRLLLVLFVVGAACAGLAANIGQDDRLVSITGAPGTTASDAFSPAVAFDDVNQRYLLVWSTDEVDGDFRIYGRLLTGAAGVPIGTQFAIGTAGTAGTDQRQPVIAFDPSRKQYLVVWSSDAADPGAYEITGQMVGSDGQLIGAVQRYSDMGGTDADTRFDAVTPDVAWHPGLDNFIVVWAGDDDTGDLSDGRFEIYGQLVEAASGAQVGSNDFRITYAGSDSQGNDALEPSLAVVPGPDRWFVAFEGVVFDLGVHDPEIFYYGCTGDVPDELGFLLSLMGGAFSDGLSGRHPDLVWVPSGGELLCVWDGENGGGTPRAIYGQRFLVDNTLVGGMISFFNPVGPAGGTLREAIEPSIAIDPVTDELFIAWRGDLDDGLIKFDHEIWACRYDDTGVPIDTFAFPLSSMDPSLDPVAGAGAPAVAINSVHGYKLIAWSGDLDTTAGGENEIFVQAWADDAFSGVDTTPTAFVFALHDAAPNPFNPQTTISFDLPKAESVSLKVYDTAGRLVRTLLAASFGQAGYNEVVWNGRDNQGNQAASGVYLYRLETAQRQDVGRMTLVK